MACSRDLHCTALHCTEAAATQMQMHLLRPPLRGWTRALAAIKVSGLMRNLAAMCHVTPEILPQFNNDITITTTAPYTLDDDKVQHDNSPPNRPMRTAAQAGLMS